jgi:hypothetical protein
MKEIPFYIYKVNEDDETGVYFNAFVDRPAHKKGWDMFNFEEQSFSVDEEKRIVTGVLISVGTPIYRRGNGLEHYAIINEESASVIVQKCFTNNFSSSTNANHTEELIKGAKMVALYQVSKSNPKLPNVPEAFANQNLQDGSVIVSYKITDDKVWNDAKNGKFNGFSAEGIFEKVPVKVKSKFSNMIKKTKTIWEYFGLVSSKFEEATTKDGVVVFYDGELAVGTPVFIELEGVRSPAPVGTHELTLKDGSVKIIVLDASGMVQSIEDFKQDEPAGNEAPVTQGEFAEFVEKFGSVTMEKITALETENAKFKEEIEILKAGEKFKPDPKKGANGIENKKPFWTSK